MRSVASPGVAARAAAAAVAPASSAKRALTRARCQTVLESTKRPGSSKTGVSLAVPASAAAETLIGSGSVAAQPVLTALFHKYTKLHPDEATACAAFS